MSGGRKLQKIRRRIEHWQIIAFYLVIYDIAAVNLSYFGACGCGSIFGSPAFQRCT